MHRYAVAAIILLLPGMTPCSAAAGSDARFDWQPWQSLATQDGGRVKPLDSLAGETLRSVAHRSSLADPDTGRKLDGVQLYLVLLLEWQGWDRTPGTQSASGKHSSNNYFGPHQPDKWDRLPLIPVDDLGVAHCLGDRERPEVHLPV